MRPVLSLTKAAIVIMALTLGSNVLGFVREMLIASRFGAGMESDAYYISITATSLIISLISTAIATTFMPVLFEIHNKEGMTGKIRQVNNMLHILFLFSAVLMVIGYSFTPQIMRVLASGFSEEQFHLAVRLTWIGLPKLLFIGTGVLTIFLQSEHRQVSTASLGIISNAVIVVFLVLPSERFGVSGLAYAALIAFALKGVIQFLAAGRIGYRYIACLRFKDPYIIKTLMISFPVFISMAANDINTIVDRTLASSLETGSISALNYSSKLNSLILAVFASAVVTVIFPLLSKESSANNMQAFKNMMEKGVRYLLLLTVPATVALMLFAGPIVKISFMRGEFDLQDSLMTAGALVFYSLGLIPFSLRLLLEKAFFSLQDSKTPMINGVAAILFNIALNLLLVRCMAHCGLALATSLAGMIAAVFLMRGLWKKIGSYDIRSFLVCGMKSCAASAAMGAAAFGVYNGLLSLFGTGASSAALALTAAAFAGILVYISCCCALRIREMKMLLQRLTGR